MAENARTTMAEAVTQGALAADSGSRQGVIAVGGILGALAASSCCILPLVLTLLGVGGA